MDFIAKKYTVLVGNEPIHLWIKNNEIKRAMFMERANRIKIDLDTIKKIQEFPTKIVNSDNLKSKKFNQAFSKMISQNLDLAIAKNDKRVLSRFARSNLVPKQSKERFMEAINRPRGLRGLVLSTADKTNTLLQNLAKKIDRFFDKVKNNLSNENDKHLETYKYIENFEKQFQHFKNETLEDFKILSKYQPDNAIDLLVKNKEYQKMDSSQKEEFENKYIFTQEPILERAKETQEIAKELKQQTKEISKEELQERVENISSKKSFEELKNEKGEIDADKLLEYSQKLESIGLALKESANQKSVTREDLQRADKACEQQQNQGVEHERA